VVVCLRQLVNLQLTSMSDQNQRNFILESKWTFVPDLVSRILQTGDWDGRMTTEPDAAGHSYHQHGGIPMLSLTALPSDEPI